MQSRFLFLDTSTTCTGYALYSASDVLGGDGKPRSVFLWYYGNVLVPAKAEFETRTIMVNGAVRTFIQETRPMFLVQEFPTFQEGMRGGMAARRGDTLKLAYMCGKIACAWELYLVEEHLKGRDDVQLVENVPFVAWNGQLPKAITCQRFMERFKIEVHANTKDNNFVDACMMGDWWFGKQGVPVMYGVTPERRDLKSKWDMR